MANRGKPIDLRTGTLSKDKARSRKEVENALKSGESILKEPPNDLCTRGQEVYREILEAFPEDFLCKVDAHIVAVVADALANMEKIRLQINELDPIAASETKLIITYQKYTDILRKFSTELGLSPSGRSQLGYLKAKEQEVEQDKLLKVLNFKK